MKKMPAPRTQIAPENSEFLQEIAGNRVLENSEFLKSRNKINRLRRKSETRRIPDLSFCDFLKNTSYFKYLRRNSKTGFTPLKG